MSRTRWRRGRKYDTPRGAKACQFGVTDNQGYRGAPVVVDCGKAAVAEWQWGGDPLRVCEEHDEEIRGNEPANAPGVTRRALPETEGEA